MKYKKKPQKMLENANRDDSKYLKKLATTFRDKVIKCLEKELKTGA